jgi:bifunctional DNA-binding transcriptional regulator/antitoxin component of YhaV-PrlF toxin-antitoxin module
MEERRIDAQGRISLPVDWRREVLGDAEEVLILRRGEELVVRPKRSRRPSDFFDSIEVDLESDLSDWHAVKRELMNPREAQECAS